MGGRFAPAPFGCVNFCISDCFSDDFACPACCFFVDLGPWALERSDLTQSGGDRKFSKPWTRLGQLNKGTHLKNPQNSKSKSVLGPWRSSRAPEIHQKHRKSLPMEDNKAAPLAPPPWGLLSSIGKDFLCFWYISGALLDLHRPCRDFHFLFVFVFKNLANHGLGWASSTNPTCCSEKPMLTMPR